jgi:hypothetical protein
MATQWHINGDWMFGCNCDYGCPCNFTARPSKGDCKGSMGFYVEDGAYDGVSLNGLHVFLAVKWPGAVYEGNGTVAIYIDESAALEQRDALLKIVSGEAGGPPFEILAGTFTKSIGPKFVPIDVKVAGKDTEVTVGDYVLMKFESIRHPKSGAETDSKVVLPKGFIFKEADQYSLKEFWVKDGPEFEISLSGTCAELAKVQWPSV